MGSVKATKVSMNMTEYTHTRAHTHSVCSNQLMGWCRTSHTPVTGCIGGVCEIIKQEGRKKRKDDLRLGEERLTKVWETDDKKATQETQKKKKVSCDKIEEDNIHTEHSAQ